MKSYFKIPHKDKPNLYSILISWVLDVTCIFKNMSLPGTRVFVQSICTEYLPCMRPTQVQSPAPVWFPEPTESKP